MVTLTGTGRLADDIYLLAHHEVSGRPFLQPRAIGLGLAGGLLAELVLIGASRIANDRVAVTDRIRPDDGLMRAVQLEILPERQRHGVRDWLTFLAQTAAEHVARRLEHSGYLVLAQSRRPWRADRWVPVDADCAFAPLIRVRAALDPLRPMTQENTALAGLAVACGLGPRGWRSCAAWSPGGLAGVQLVTSDCHQGLRDAIASVLPGASRQRCRTHYHRNLLTRVPKSARPWVPALVRTTSGQPDAASVRDWHAQVAPAPEARFPQAAAHLDDARDDILAFTASPREIWRRMCAGPSSPTPAVTTPCMS